MSILLIVADDDADRAASIEQKIAQVIPDITKVRTIDDISRETLKHDGERTYVLFIASPNASEHINRIVRIAEKYRDRFFFIVISHDIAGSDYKRLIQTGGAEWVSSKSPPHEILDIIRHQNEKVTAEPTPSQRPCLISFVPSAGGVGNSLLAVEVATQLARDKSGRTVCLLDLDFQTSHVCDYLDIQPRLQIDEISANPARLDSQLLDVFVSRHNSGLNVFAAPRSRLDICSLNFAALDRLFELISSRYDLILIDLPVGWLAWTPQILSASEAVILTALNSIPGLRQTAEALASIRALPEVPSMIQVVINRCKVGALGRIVQRQYVNSILKNENPIYVREDGALIEAVNAGIPNAIDSPRSKVSREIAEIAQICRAAAKREAADGARPDPAT
jgi:pilus assembly protein CpaE